MPKLTLVSRERHAGKKWRRGANYAFAETTALAQLGGVEIARAALAMPIAFAEHSGRFVPVAVMSVSPGHNFFVGPDGRWLGGYVPAGLRGYPFQLVQEGANNSALAVYEDSALVIDGDESGEEFFDSHGNLSPQLKSVANFLAAVARSQVAVAQAAVALAKAGLIQPWEIKVRTDRDAEEKAIHGLYRVDEGTLNALGDDAFISLRNASALPIAYAQLISMEQLAIFERLASLHAQWRQAPSREVTSLDEIFSGSAGDQLVRFE